MIIIKFKTNNFIDSKSFNAPFQTEHRVGEHRACVRGNHGNKPECEWLLAALATRSSAAEIMYIL